MELEVSLEVLRKRKLMVATPMYGGMCAGTYTKSCTELAKLAAKYEVECQFYYLFNESLITRARNYLADEFMRSDCTHMIFLDSDIGFNPNDVMAMLAIMGEDTEYDIMCAPYPKKVIAWEKIKDAVDRGFADEDANNLERFVGDFVFNPAKGQTEIKLSDPVEVLESGTGFMMIQKRAFEKFDIVYPELKYMPDHVRTKHFDGTRMITAYFDTVIDPESKRYLSEDYMFCQYSRAAGVKVWLCPWMKTSHMGSYFFGGSLSDMAQIGASATVDPDKIKAKR
jgi:hypothetical protein